MIAVSRAELTLREHGRICSVGQIFWRQGKNPKTPLSISAERGFDD
jgi:hypothetical protein